ncbi:MAG: CoA pyrophosphatase [Nitrososphaerota archaeon]|nr:CoA pyrophosphatase [Nitrososphaerota archaeon]MDG6942840.1 CoA pyrophosphatase [Nitrososphaerota archaeon]MDG6950840.1 CoA pyrophosphatase [Nitrososphaerota archaeon]
MAEGIVEKVARTLSVAEPTPVQLEMAAVSMIFRDPKRPAVLLIERAERAGDPWSGQIALPGGKMRAGDGTARNAAVRETFEEVGVDLERSAEFLGYGQMATTHIGTMGVVPSIFLLRDDVTVKPNSEVASFRWIGVEELRSSKSQSSYTVKVDGKSVVMPAILVGGYLIWGLTYRIILSALWPP